MPNACWPERHNCEKKRYKKCHPTASSSKKSAPTDCKRYDQNHGAPSRSTCERAATAPVGYIQASFRVAGSFGTDARVRRLSDLPGEGSDDRTLQSDRALELD